jgi:CRISPR-associated protein Cmr6
MATNIGHLYYKQYFKGLKLHKDTGIPEKKQKLDAPINGVSLYELKISDYSNLINIYKNQHQFQLTTSYPGLLIGSGYIHEVGGKEIESELKLGFYFDHTTGIPMIPGSSVKGLLRSAFAKATEKFKIGDEKVKASKYVRELLKEITKEEWSLEKIYKLEKSIFEGENSTSTYNRDIFFDAYPISSGNDNGKFLANDYITPHDDPLKNPTPLQFLKVLPNVQFQFNFKLTDNGLNAELKRDLIKHILLDLGIGAKTNVGYGQFDPDPPINIYNTNKQFEKKEHISTEDYTGKPGHSSEGQLQFKETVPSVIRSKLTSGKHYRGTVVSISGDFCMIRFEVENKMCEIRKKYTAIRNEENKKLNNRDEVKENFEVLIHIIKDYQFGSNLNCQVKLNDTQTSN